MGKRAAVRRTINIIISCACACCACAVAVSLCAEKLYAEKCFAGPQVVNGSSCVFRICKKAGTTGGSHRARRSQDSEASIVSTSSGIYLQYGRNTSKMEVALEILVTEPSVNY